MFENNEVQFSQEESEYFPKDKLDIFRLAIQDEAKILEMDEYIKVVYAYDNLIKTGELKYLVTIIAIFENADKKHS